MTMSMYSPVWYSTLVSLKPGEAVSAGVATISSPYAEACLDGVVHLESSLTDFPVEPRLLNPEVVKRSWPTVTGFLVATLEPCHGA